MPFFLHYKIRSSILPSIHGKPILALLSLFICLSFVFLFRLSAYAQDVTNFDDEIIFIGEQGKIEILDITQSSEVLLDWVSNETDFVDFALGDFTGDGDPEIAAIRGVGEAGQLFVYDPVVSPNTSIPDGRSPNGVPWKLLYQRNIGYTPTIIGAGNLDDSTEKDEILIGYDLESNRSEIVILAIEGVNELQGTGAIDLILGGDGVFRFERSWESVSIGQIDGEGPDEIVLTDSTIIPDRLQSTIAFYRVDGLAEDAPFFKRGNSFASWRSTEIGEVNGNGLTDIVAMRKVIDGAARIPTLFFFEYDAGQETIRDNDDGCPDEPHVPQSCPDDVDSLRLLPRPAHVLLADINQNNEQEMFFLRSSPFVNNTTVARFFLINRGTDQIKDINQDILDADTRHPVRSRDLTINPLDNLWNTGTGGDFDGDGDDEIAIGRPDRIVTYIFRNGDFPIIRQDTINTNNLQMKAANIDSLGFATGVEVIAETSGLQSNITAGSTLDFVLSVRTFDESLIAGLDLPEQPSWLSAATSIPTSGQVPYSVTLTIDATDLVPGSYSFDTLVSSSDRVVTNSPSRRTFSFQVQPAQIAVDVERIEHVLHPCNRGSLNQQPSGSYPIDISGTTGITYTATITPSDNWLAFDDGIGGGVIPDSLMINIDPALASTTDLSLEGTVLIQADERTGTGGTFNVPILLLCAPERLYGPIVAP